LSDIHSFEPIFGAWYVEELIGRGNYGQVYRARRSEYGNTFYSAIKHISIEESPDYSSEQVVQALSRELNISYQLRGESHFVSYEDSTVVKKPDGKGYDVFIRMELLTSLPEHMRGKALEEKEVIRLGIDICEALDGLERRGILHRDVKPANIFISPAGSYKLGDFGVARSLRGTTAGMTIAGSFNYMAPELYRGGMVNHTADIYSLGLVLYRLLNANRSPFLPLPPAAPDYDASNEAMLRRMNGEPLPPPAYASAPLAAVILRACAFDSAQRYQSAREFGDALRAVLSGSPALEETVSIRQSRAPLDETVSTWQPGPPLDATVSAWQPAPQQPAPQQSQSKSWLKWLFIGLGIVAVAAIAVLALYLGGVIGGRGDNRAAVTPELPSPSETAQVSEPASPSGSASQSLPTPSTAVTAADVYYTVNATSSSGGYISPSGSIDVLEGETVTYRIYPDEGYETESVIVNGTEQRISSVYELQVYGDTTISVYFAQVETPHEYSVVQANVTWAEASSSAVGRGGHLATVNSEEEFDELVRLAEAADVHVLLIGGYLNWSGASYTAYWVTGESFSYSDWLSGEPNNDQGVENCLALMMLPDGTWGYCDVPNDAYTYYANRNIVGYAIEWEG